MPTNRTVAVAIDSSRTCRRPPRGGWCGAGPAIEKLPRRAAVTPGVTRAPFRERKSPLTYWLAGKLNREASRLGDVGPRRALL